MSGLCLLPIESIYDAHTNKDQAFLANINFYSYLQRSNLSKVRYLAQFCPVNVLWFCALVLFKNQARGSIVLFGFESKEVS